MCIDTGFSKKRKIQEPKIAIFSNKSLSSTKTKISRAVVQDIWIFLQEEIAKPAAFSTCSPADSLAKETSWSWNEENIQ